MEKITLIDIEWNEYNGFIFDILNVEAGNFNRSLFGMYFSESFAVIELMYIRFKLFDKTGTI